MIHTDADGSMMLLADVEERYEANLNLLKFVGILLVVARIDAHFLTIESSHVGNVRIEVNISYERSPIAVGTDAGIVFHVLCLAGTLSGEAHQFATSLDNLLSLLYASLGIIGVGGGHRMDEDRFIATPAEGSYMCHRRVTACIIE